ncbi:hypothetical protein SARC_02008 [Sphaeroforma arctica JP610]|uniref:Dolichyl-diphosphooligosaccharide--protein glycosyltransferase 48 kDa subunit n=1 Tax=Sphaeroforma arctica JP610 TaxID=667725 RepID=A0A0L0G9Z3_9EUKA|nr:hypothetical protein SARC_02008 [Sphaeroforma arctica JP610]KNC85825.1 hypothetical protein SARC_02008 [Sphaeroforma arctica JP610]|eukprot:XP_014159727.1 hypothetical protein SARC_02008 [Sphaeroforma arctica JP610]
MYSFIRLALVTLASTYVAAGETDFYAHKPRTVVVASKEQQKTHAGLIELLQSYDHDVTVKQKADVFGVRMLGERIIDNLIILDNTVDALAKSKVDGVQLMSYVDSGGNLLIAGGVETGALFDQVARHAGFVTSPHNLQLVDHFVPHSFDSGNHQTIAVETAKANKAVLETDASALIYNGPALKIARGKLSFAVLRAPSTSYAGAHCHGEDCVLVGGMEARNNARVLVVGSTDMLSDANAKASKSNEVAQKSMMEWITMRKSVVRTRKVEVLSLAPKLEGAYTVMDEVEYAIELEELVNGEWVGFTGRSDLQMTYTRMDPFVTRDLTEAGDGRYFTRFSLPDVYGLFTFKVKYTAHGYSWVDEELTLVIKPLRNNMHQRWIPGAFPYYTSALSMMGGVLAVSFVYLYHSDVPQKNKKV